MASVRQLVEVEAAGKLRLLEVSSNVLVGHLLHAGLEEVVFLEVMLDIVFERGSIQRTSSSDQERLPPADILRARRLEGSGD